MSLVGVVAVAGRHVHAHDHRVGGRTRVCWHVMTIIGIILYFRALIKQAPLTGI